MKAYCVHHYDHDRFSTSATVSQDWAVDREGNFLTELATVQTVHGPDPENFWRCQVCGAVAKVVDHELSRREWEEQVYMAPDAVTIPETKIYFPFYYGQTHAGVGAGNHTLKAVPLEDVLQALPLDVLSRAIEKAAYVKSGHVFEDKSFEDAKENMVKTIDAVCGSLAQMPKEYNEANDPSIVPTDETDDQYMERQQRWYERLTVADLKQYQGAYVWVEDGYIKDSGPTRAEITMRAYKALGMRPLFVVRVPMFTEHHFD